MDCVEADFVSDEEASGMEQSLSVRVVNTVSGMEIKVEVGKLPTSLASSVCCVQQLW